MIFRILIPIFLLCAFLLPASLVMAAPPVGLQPALDGIIRDAPLDDAKVGVYVEALDNKETWYARRADEGFMPASTAKVVTTAIALEQLGADYRFDTRILADGKVINGVLQGDLYLEGGGDPTLQTAHLRQLAKTVASGDQQRGIDPIREVSGSLVIDDSFFPRSGPLLGEGWSTDNLPWYYAAPSSALSSNENAVTVTVRGTKNGAPPQITTSPNTDIFTYANSAITRSGAGAGVSITREGSTLRVDGSISPGVQASQLLSVSDPARFTADQFREALQHEGVTVNSERMGEADYSRVRLVSEHHSAPLSDILTDMMKRSDNHIAEQVHWTLLAHMHKSTPLSRRFNGILEETAKRYNAPVDGIDLVDGCGLSRKNRVTPKDMAALLSGMASSSNAATFRKTFPVAGVDGTLRRRMTNSAATGNALGKTGTIDGVSALAGYVDTGSAKRRVSYVIFVNGVNSASSARRMQDRVVSYLARAESKPEMASVAQTVRTAQPVVAQHSLPPIGTATHSSSQAATTTAQSDINQLIIKSMLNAQKQRAKKMMAWKQQWNTATAELYTSFR